MNKNKKRKKYGKIGKIINILIIIGVIAALALTAVNLIVYFKTKDRVFKPDEAKTKTADCIIVLGCGVWKGGIPSHMLADRISVAVELYENGVADKIIMSGDNKNDDYDEPGVMKKYAVEAGVPSDAIYIDPYGLSTYESIKRAKDVFGVESAVIVTQKYHTYRTLYIADKMEITSVFAVNSDPRSYSGQIFRDVRELVGRAKDMIFCMFSPETTYVSKPIDKNKNGDEINLKQ